MKKQIFLLALNLFCIGGFAQNFQWAKSLLGPGIDEGMSIVADASGDIYTTGIFNGTVDFDPGPGVYNLTSAGINDIYISKIDGAGNFLWAKRIGSADYDNGNAITLDAAGNVFITGFFNLTVDFDPGAGTFNLTSNGSNDIFVLKLDSAGNFIWAKSFGGTSVDEGTSIATDASGNVYTTGGFLMTVDFDPGAPVFNLNSGGSQCAFISKLDPSGNFVFAKSMAGTGGLGRGITIDATGNIYSVGNFNGTVDFDPNAGAMNLSSAGANDIYVSKLNSFGNFVWAKSIGSTTWDYGYAIDVDGAGNVYTTGTYGGAADFDPNAGISNLTNAGGNDIFILKLDVSGNYLWAKGIGSTGGDFGSTIEIDGPGNLYIAGSYEGTVDFNPNAGINNLISNGWDDAYILKLDANGNYIWAQSIGSTGSLDRHRDIVIDGGNNLCTTGGFAGTVDFDAGASTFNIASAGSTDIFILKISCLPGLAGVISGPSVACQGSVTNYSIPPVSGATGYSWTVPGGTSINSGQNTNSINVTIGASSGMVVVTPTNSCGSSPSVSLSITSATSPTITSSASPNFICPGGTSTLSASGPLLLDQQSTSGVTTGFWMSLSGQQSFLAGLTGVLKKVRVHTATYASATTVTLKVYSGPVGGGSLLTTVSYGKGTNTNSWDDVILPGGGVSVTAAMPYYIEILAGSQVDWIYRNVNVYANGQAWRGGTSYTYDYNFETYIDQNTYLWNPGAAPTQTFVVSPPSSTNYTVTVTNAAGCANTQQVLLNVNPIMNANAVITNVSCNGGTNGAIDLTVTGGTPPYITYAWSNGQTTQDITNLLPGSYNVTITDANGCTKPASGIVNQPGILTASSAITTSINCNGGTGIVSVSGGGGTPPYTGTGSFTVTAGTYNYNVTDANGCIKTTSITVTQPAPLTINVNSPITICLGSIANLTATGASTYTWNPGGLTGANVAVSPVTTTVYTVTGTSTLGCVGTNTTTVTVNPNPTVTVSSSTICVGSTTTLTASGATTYSWNTGAATTSIVVSPGSTTNYTVTGTNGFGCTNTKTTSVTVNLLPSITTTASPTSICVGSNSNLTASGATSYTWNPGGLTGSAVTVSPASTTVYTVTGINSNGCVNTQTINLTVNNLPVVTAAASPTTMCAGATATLNATGGSTYTWSPGGATTQTLTVSPASSTNYTVTATNAAGCINTQTVNLNVNPAFNSSISFTNVTCNGGNDGAINLTVTGGLPPNTYLWSNSQTTEDIANLPAGVYNVTVTDMIGCTTVTGATITQPALLIAGSALTTSINCNGGTGVVSVSASGGVPPYIGTGSFTVTAGTYTYNVVDANGCLKTTTINVVQPAPLTITVSASSSICSGETTTLTATGASTYTWNPGGLTGASVGVTPGSTTVYTATGTSSLGCVATNTTSVTVNPNPTVTVSSSTICVGGTTTLTASGATTYSWNTGATTASIAVSPGSTTNYTITGTNGFGCVNTKTTSVTVNLLPTITASVSPAAICAGSTATLTGTGASTYTWNPGSLTGSVVSVSPGSTTLYTVTGTNGNGCVNTQTVNLTVNTLPTLTVVSSSTVICAGETATITGSGASTYTWNPGVLTGSAISVNPASSTVYTVTGTNGSGCAQTETISLTVNVLPVVTAAATTSAICAGETTTLTAGGAVTYLWDSGASTSVITVTPTALTVYTVTGTDGNNCVNSETVSVTVNSLPVITAISSPTAICTGAAATLTATGATSYTWNPGVLTGPTISVSPASSTIYTLTGANGSGCVQSETISLTVNALPVVTANSTASAVCNGQPVTLNGSGAFSYAWDNGVVDGVAFMPGASGTYIVTGTDVNGCVGMDTAFVTVNSLPVIIAGSTSTAVCNGDFASLTGSGVLTYTWNPGALTGATVSVNPSSNTIYTLSGTDGAGCVNTETISLTVNPLPVVTATASPVSICAGQTSTLSAAGAASYTWNPGALTGASIAVSPSSTTVYTVTGVDGSGCANTGSVSLSVSVNPTVTAVSSPSVICEGQTAILTASGASMYSWNTGANTFSTSVSPTSTSVYTVTGTNGTNCTHTETISLTVNMNPTVIIAASPSAICIGQTSTLTASGASTYLWDTGAGTSAIAVSPASTTIYTVTGTNSTNCTHTETVSLTVNALPVILVSPSNTVICEGKPQLLQAFGATTYTLSGTGSVSNSITVSPTVTTAYTVTGTDANGCENEATAVVNTISQPVVSINTPSTNVCMGYTMTVVASGASNYNWSNGATTNSITVQPFSNITYSVIGSNGGACPDTAFLSLNVLPLPSVSASANSTLICAGNTVSLTAGGTAVYFLWEPDSLLGPNQTVQMNTPTTFTVYGQGSNGCAFFSTTFVDVPSSTAITPVVTPSAICAGESATLSVSGATISLWSGNAVPNTSVVIPFNNTTYTFSATDVNGCTSDIAFTVLMKSDCSELVVYNGFTPNGDGINDVWLIDNIEKFPNNKVFIYNRWGNAIYHTTNYNNADNSWNGKLNGHAIDPGTYFYIIVDESEKLIKKGWLEITN